MSHHKDCPLALERGERTYAALCSMQTTLRVTGGVPDDVVHVMALAVYLRAMSLGVTVDTVLDDVRTKVVEFEAFVEEQKAAEKGAQS